MNVNKIMIYLISNKNKSNLNCKNTINITQLFSCSIFNMIFNAQMPRNQLI